MLGLYDSGSGGLTVLTEIQRFLPQVSFQYLADYEFLPLGQKTPKEIKHRTQQACEFLFTQGCSLIVLACNTSAVNSIRYLQSEWLVDFRIKKQKKTNLTKVSLIKSNKNQNQVSKENQNYQVLSLTKPFTEDLQIKENLKTKKGLLLATEATIKSNFYQQEFFNLGYRDIDYLAMPALAKVIESENFQEIRQNLEFNFREIDLLRYDFLLLACTHYPLITKIIRSYFRLDLKIFDPSKPTAARLVDYLERHPEYSLNLEKSKFFTTKVNLKFAEKIKSIFDQEVIQINL